MTIKTLPGTNISLPHTGYSVHTLMSSLFLAGGLVLSQVSSLTDLPPYVLQNWVKRGFVPPPVNKKYSQNQFCRIAIINSLKDILQIDVIVKMIHYASVYGDETALYTYFVQTLMLAENDINKLDIVLEANPSQLRVIIKPMSVFYISSQIKGSAELMLAALEL